MAVILQGICPGYPQARFDYGEHELVIKFRVFANSVFVGPIEVVTCPGLPIQGDLYAYGAEFHPTARCRTVVPERQYPNSTVWIVTATYRTPELKGGGGSGGDGADRADSGGGSGEEQDGQFENPMLEIPEMEWGDETIQIPITQVYDTSTASIIPCKASNGEIFVPAPVKEENRMTLTITRNEHILSAHPATGLQYQQTVNSDVFWGSPAGTVKCQSITFNRQAKQLALYTIPYLRVKYVFKFLSDWDKLILDSGSFYKESVGTAERKIRFKGDDGQPIQGLLDGTGHKLADGGTPVYIRIRPYLRQKFAPLLLPQSPADCQ